MRERLSRLSPEEIAGGVLLAAALVAVALQPAAIGRVFESPYATPAPESVGGGILEPHVVDLSSESDRIATRTLPSRVMVSGPAPGSMTFPETPTSVRNTVSDACREAALRVMVNGTQYVVCAPFPPSWTTPPLIRAPAP